MAVKVQLWLLPVGLVGLAVAMAGLVPADAAENGVVSAEPVASSADPKGEAIDGADGELVPRDVPTKPERSTIPSGYTDGRLHLKLVEGSEGRVRNGAITAAAENLDELNAILTRHPGTRVARLFSRPEEELAREKLRIEARSGREQADKNLYFLVELPPGVDATAVLDDLNALDVVEIAYPEPLPQPSPATPNFEPLQLYRDAAPTGVDVGFASSFVGGGGD